MIDKRIGGKVFRHTSSSTSQVGGNGFLVAHHFAERGDLREEAVKLGKPTFAHPTLSLPLKKD